MKIKNYDVVKILYESSKTIVYAARSSNSSAEYVIKMPAAEYPDEAQVNRLDKEFQMMKLLPPRISVEPIEFIEDGNMVALVLERFGERLGESAHALAYDDLEKTALFIRLAEALGRLHRQGLIHKDINPSNLLVNEEDDVRIIDFGLSCRGEECKKDLDMEGTLAYTSPEQTGRLNRRTDYRTDYYALGATFYQLLTGRTLFSETLDRNRIIHQQIARQPLAPRRIRHDIPELLSRIVMKLLEKNPDDRYQSIEGLIYDLESVLKGEEPDRPLGKKDQGDRFILSNKLIDRELELSRLRVFCSLESENRSNVMMVLGENGIGKTALVKSVRRILEREGRLVGIGSYDAQRANVPYHGLLDALGQILDHLLVYEEDALSVWRSRLRDTLGRSAGIIAELLPQLEYLLGAVEPVSVIGAEESKKRFFRVFCDFIAAFGTKRRPVVLFLEDAHHIDSSSVEMLAYLTTSTLTDQVHIVLTAQTEGLFQIEGHPVSILRHQLASEGITIEEVDLKPLSREAVVEWLHENRLEAAIGSSMAEEVFARTQGNPLYLQFLLKYCLEKEILIFNAEKGYFEMDAQRLSIEGLPEQLTGLMISDLRLQTEGLTRFLYRMALLGYCFSLEMMNVVREPDETWENQVDLLIQAVDKGFLTLSKIAMEEEDVVYQFASEKVHQAVLGLYEDSPKVQYLAYARAFVENLGLKGPRMENRIFDICSYYEYAIPTVEDFGSLSLEEQRVLTRLNHLAGAKAKRSSALEIAYAYLEKAQNYGGLSSLYSLSEEVELGGELAELASLIGDENKMNFWIQYVQGRTAHLHENLKVDLVRIRHLIGKGERDKALDDALDVLGRLGLTLPRHPGKATVLKTLISVRMKLGSKPVEKLKVLQPMEDSEVIAMMEVMTSVSSSAYLSNSMLYVLIALKQLELTIRSGTSAIGFNAYTLYGLVLCGMLRDYEKGYQIGKLAIEAAEHLSDEGMTAKIHIHTGLFISHFKEHLTSSRAQVAYGAQVGLASGDYEYAAWGLYVSALYDFYLGKNLETVKSRFSDCKVQIKSLNQQTQLQLSEVFEAGVSRLLQDERVTRLTEADEEVAEAISSQHQSAASSLFYYYLHHMIRLYHYGGLEDAAKASKQAGNHLEAVVSTFNVPMYLFYDALIRMKRVKSGHFSYGERSRQLKAVKRGLDQLQRWSRLSPANHRHRVKLLEAELAATKGHQGYQQAAMAYEEAMSAAKHSGYLSDEALATELAAEFYRACGQSFIAGSHIKRAMHLYHKWGFENKVRLMADVHAELIMMRKHSDYSDLNLSTAGLVPGVMMDVSSVLKAAQTLSTEINENKLIRTFMQIISENIGADKAVLFVMENKEPTVRAFWNIEQEESTLGDEDVTIRVDASYEQYPRQIVHYAARTLNEVMLSWEEMDERFVQDPYIREHQPRSILCMPMVLKKSLKGILYLENNRTPHAFRRTQNDMVEAISTQLAISLENSRLYAHLEEEIKERTTELRELSNRYRQLSITDQLTGLLNRRELDDKLRHEHARIKRYGGDMAIILLDIDHFKKVNDTFGHIAGDQALMAFADLLRGSTRESDFVGRWGGEEFMILCPGIDLEHAILLAEKIRLQLSQMEIPDVGRITASFGVATHLVDDSIEKMVHRADVALYEAKRSGRNKVMS